MLLCGSSVAQEHFSTIFSTIFLGWSTLFSFYKNIFYKNIEDEICEILRRIFKNKPEAEILKRI